MRAAQFERITEGPPAVDPGRAGDIARAAFGVRPVEVTRLPGETDANFRIATDDGPAYVLKVSGDRDRGRVTIQNALLAHIRRQDPGLPVPRPVRTAGGLDLVEQDLDGRPVLARLLSWLPGEPLAAIRDRSDELYADIGATAGRLAAAMAGAPPGDRPEPHYWDLRDAEAALDQCVPFVTDSGLGAGLGRARELLAERPVRWAGLPTAFVHHDLNALNILVGGPPRRTCGIVDFGDALHTARVADLAVLLAALTRIEPRPLRVAGVLAAAYHRAAPLTEDEVDALYPLLVARVATVAATTARLAEQGGHGDPRHRVPDTARQLARLVDLPPDFATATLRAACGFDPYPAGARARAWIAANPRAFHPVVAGRVTPVDLSAASELFDEVDPRRPDDLWVAVQAGVVAGSGPAVTRYAEPWFPRSARRATGAGEAATVSLGVALFGGGRVHAPLAGVVEATEGGVVLRHEVEPGVRFWTRFSGVRSDLPVGSPVEPGQPVGHLAGPDLRSGPGLVSGDDRYSATRHSRGAPPGAPSAQLTVVRPAHCAVPTHVRPSELEVWQALVPDSSALLGVSSGIRAWRPALPEAMAGRQAHLPRTHPTYFADPIDMVRARDCFFYDEQGHAYLDALNNVTLVGHGHPRLVRAAARQLARLNTNSRFVYGVLTEYAARLTATLPEGLDVVYFLNSGSEANDLALRMARYVTGREDIAVIEHAYHGYTSLVSDVSPARYKRYGKPGFTHPTPAPDRYRGEFGYDDPDSGARYATRAAEVFAAMGETGRPPAAFIYESLLAGGGQVVLPPGYLAEAQRAARAHGALTIADEVQVGFGRLGDAFWGFQTHGADIRPDFVTMGKAMGNGFPVAAMVTTREISERFDATGRFFSTYGGNPVACAVGLELLDVLEEEGLQANARRVGQYLRDRLWRLAEHHPLIGDVRGQGFYSGVELVADRETKLPAPAETLLVCERLKDEGVLVYPTGPDWNVLKLKPPLTFTEEHADALVDALDLVLRRNW
ncbi:aminotransferase class III-fold pyridoxal phosphate-dependent enzyme [Pseudonocardia eucalypti]|uniref:Aminotransferase class III-fold pyridoxal phosphate-dependent enzyme n=1 Tax=Pseudonocardia eucalypti TaxID=648755 RepID=A0ABP9QP60_9PSEU|nr:4-aminobutyrate aminotransferase-like enzyme/Ser/Thr protein kinase RdoA (MazF antagonist) [Pseudonocardia eucalypti]